MTNEYKIRKNKLKNEPSSFPELHTLGEMRPISQTIHLHNADRDDFIKFGKGELSVSALQETMEVYLHESTHWYDLISTTWGVNYLDSIYECLDIPTSDPYGGEDKYHKIISNYDEERRILLPEYYHLILEEKNQHSTKNPWKIQFSCGTEFDSEGRINESRPILFTRFHDRKTNELIARQPITTGALIESKAMASEIQTAIDMMAASSADRDEFRVNLSIYGRKISEIIYDKNLTTYTSPSHLLSYFIDSKEATTTYLYAASIANAALHMTPDHFEHLNHPQIFEPFGEEKLEYFKKSYNRGYAFAAISVQAPKYSPDTSLADWLDASLKNAGLPNWPSLINDAIKNISERPSPDLQNERLKTARFDLNEYGMKFLQSISKNGHHWITPQILSENNILFPPAFDGLGELFNIGPELSTKSFYPTLSYDLEVDFIEYRNNLLRGVRGVRLIGT